MELRHQNEIEAKTKELDTLLPLKVKESTECLNLRKMEEHMAKQKKYIYINAVTLKHIKSNRRLLNSK